jgi:ABC-2 type transport system permease protein
MKAFLHLSLTTLRMYVREPLTVFLSLGLLVLMMVLFGVMANDMSNIRLPIAVLDRSNGANPMLKAFEHDEVLSCQRVASREEIVELIRTGKVFAGVTLNPPSSRKDEGARLIVSDSAPNQWVRMGLSRIQLLLGHPDVTLAQDNVERVHVPVISNRFIDFVFPGVLALAVLQTCLSSAVVLLDAKRIGVLRRLQLTPIRPLHWFGGFLAGRCIIVLLHLLVLTGVALVGFHIHILASVGQMFACLSLGMFCFMAMAGAIAILSPSFEAGAVITQLLNFPMSFLCGVFFRNEDLPHSLMWLIKLLPLTYLVNVMRGTIHAGLPLRNFSFDIGVLLAWSLGSLLVFAIAARIKSKNFA